MERLSDTRALEVKRGALVIHTIEIETPADFLRLVEDAISFAARREATAEDLLLAMSSEYGTLPGGTFYRREPVSSSPTDFAVVLQSARRKVTLEVHLVDHTASITKQVSK